MITMIHLVCVEIVSIVIQKNSDTRKTFQKVFFIFERFSEYIRTIYVVSNYIFGDYYEKRINNKRS